MKQHQPTQIYSVVGTVTDPRTVAGLTDAAEIFDVYLGLVGADRLAEILQACLPSILKGDRSTLASISKILDTVSGQKIDIWPEHLRQKLASLLGESLHNSTAVQEEINRTLMEAVQEAIRISRRDGGSNFWTELEDQQHEDLLTREFVEVESQIFDRLKRKLEIHRCASSEHAVEGGSQSSPSSLVRIRTKAQTIDGSSMVSTPQGEQEFFRKLRSIVVNGTEKQALAYIYANASRIGDDTRRRLLLGLIEDQQIPVIWKKALIRAFSAEECE